MDEIRLINILTSPSAQVKQPGIADSNSTNLPPIITRFPPGSILSGFIINRDPAGNPILRTENGDISFQSNLFLKIGTEVAIRVENRGGQPQARIISIDGQPPDTAQKVSVTPPPFDAARPESAAAPRQAPITSDATTLTPGLARVAPAVAMSVQPTITASVTTGSAQLPQGAQLTLSVVSAEPPSSGGVPGAAAQPPAPGAASSALYAAYAKLTPPSGPTPNLPQSATPAATAPAAAFQPNPTANTPTLQAVVTGNSQTGHTIIQAEGGAILQLHTNTPLANGIRLHLEISQITSPGGAALPQPETPAPIATLAHRWASMEQIVSLLSASRPDTQDNSGLSILTGLHNPAVRGGTTINPPSISTGLMVFIAALRGGDFRGWMGRDNASWLEQNGHATLVRKAEGEFMSIARQFIDAPPGQWQSLFFPIAVHGEVQQARFFLKRDRKSKEGREASGEEETRFIIELELSRMGEMQLDGFVHKEPKEMEFDLFIRSRIEMDEATQSDIFAIYNEMAQMTGFKGRLVFQTVREFPVRPLEEINPPHASDVSV